MQIFNQEAERTVKSIKTKWTPAQLKGKAVRSFIQNANFYENRVV